MTVTSADAPSALIASLAEKYMWWPGLGASGHSEERIIAQVMDMEPMKTFCASKLRSVANAWPM
jgi:hypothetical protein